MIAPAQIGPYRIERLLGIGSFATVWLGHDASLGSHVAIKVLAENWSHDLRVRERFLDEARLLWRLDHERLVRVYSVGELADGRPYSVMAWADGGSLRDRLAVEPPRVPTALFLLAEIAAGVAVLHDHGIVHRDLSPGNILFRSRAPDAGIRAGAGRDIRTGPSRGRRGEQVLIADLGLAKALAAASGLTARAGTPGYMAPEQDNPIGVVDARTDVFGLGRLGAELLGTAGTPAGRAARLRPGVPRGVAGVLRKATARQPADRYPDAAAFHAAFTRAAAPVVGQPRPGGSVSRAPGRRRRQVVAVGAAFATLAVGAATASDSVVGRAVGASPSATDGTGRITVILPDGWRAGGTGWAGQRDGDGRLDAALVISPEPRRWPTDPDTPGAFVGLSPSAAARTTTAGFVAGRPHARCAAAPVRNTRQAGIDWVVARFACADGKPVIVEAAGLGPGATGLVYVQIAPPGGSGPEFVDTLLAGVLVR